MFGIGPLELAFCGLVVLMVYGPDKLPTLARKLGRFVRDFRQISEAITVTLRREMNNLERMADEEDQAKLKSADEAQVQTNETQSTAPEPTEPDHVQHSIPRK